MSRTGRPPIAEPKEYNLKVRLDKATNDKLEKYCKDSGDTKTNTMRQALKQFLKYNSK